MNTELVSEQYKKEICNCVESYNNGHTISGGLIQLPLIPKPPFTGHVKDITVTRLLYVTACSVDKRHQHLILIFDANFYYLNEKKRR